jgi:hypothetical protein
VSSKCLVRAVVEMAVFFGTSSETAVKPDTAIEQLELMASILQEMDEQERQEFERLVAEIAQAEESRNGKTPRVVFLRSLCENLGLTAC